MKNVFRNIAAVLIGLVIGSIVNSGIIDLSGNLVALPEDVDPNDIESIKANIHLYDPIHFLFPFLAHTLGTLAGAIVATLIAVSHKLKLAMSIGFVFLLGGIAINVMLAGPIWFTILDLVLAYLPMAWLGRSLLKK
ncbi:MAG: hypothetical protein JKY48_02420 [Flavobacteriales bacterium]|nr:hypothetical protein [Flavobacteriales bacterium]